MRFSPRSLRQLVLLAFLLVLLPLLLLAYQAYRGLDNLSAQAELLNRSTLADARRSEMMSNIALEMERSYRQYCVLGDKTFAKLYQNQRTQYLRQLTLHARALPEKDNYAPLRANLNQLATPLCNNEGLMPEALVLLEQFAHNNSQMLEATRSVIYSRGEKLQQAIAERGRYFGWQALSVFVVSLVLVLLFTGMIIGPVKAIQRMINRLGEGKKLSDISTLRGPRELKSIAQQVVWLSERLAWLESQRHEFLRHISHELKTPLASMREGTDLLADEIAGPLSASQREIVGILDTSSRHLQRLIEQLLDYNRQIASTPVQISQVFLPELFDTVVQANSLPAKAKNMHTYLDWQADTCVAEPVLLARVLDNLYSNAVYYGGESGTIWVKSRQKDHRIQIDIANTGTSIPKAEREMIFEPFYQGSRQRKGAVKGSGLGLSIARDCIRRMHGELDLVQSDYAPVCFRIELPLSPEHV
ncbi:MAG: sensor histidine kinase [Plesiomonas sp.]